MPKFNIAVWNKSSVLSDAQVQVVLPALQKQVTGDFAPIWGVDAQLSFVSGAVQPGPGLWWLVILDDSDQADALGYHDVTPEGLPQGKVFADSDIKNHLEWSGTASHELLEMLADPDINLAAYVPVLDQGAPTQFLAYEVCDACEADAYGYKIDGVAVSDFVYPAWFQPTAAKGSTQFDQTQSIAQPFQILPGGYALIFDTGNGNGWQQVYGAKTEQRYHMRAPVGSRRERRRTPRGHWLRSRPSDRRA
jgi:hypothetical protein